MWTERAVHLRFWQTFIELVPSGGGTDVLFYKKVFDKQLSCWKVVSIAKLELATEFQASSFTTSQLENRLADFSARQLISELNGR